MKNDTLNLVLNIALAILVVVALYGGYRTLSMTYKVRALNETAGHANSILTRTQGLLNELTALNQHSPNPELTRILQSLPNNHH
jgi:hypothetical protein